MSKFMCYVLKSSFHISWQRIRRRGKVCDLRSIFETPSLVSSYELSKKKKIKLTNKTSWSHTRTHNAFGMVWSHKF